MIQQLLRGLGLVLGSGSFLYIFLASVSQFVEGGKTERCVFFSIAFGILALVCFVGNIRLRSGPCTRVDDSPTINTTSYIDALRL
jgi:hypothetical protein